jgi:cytochrome P450
MQTLTETTPETTPETSREPARIPATAAAAGCPFHAAAPVNTPAMQAVADQFRPFDLTDPFPFYRLAREQAPIFYSQELGYWVVTRHEDIKAVFNNWAVFSAENAQTPYRPWSAEVRRILQDGGYVGGSGLSARTPPTHTRIRQALTSVFGMKRFAKLEPVIRARARQMIAAFAGQGRAEIVRDLAWELPAYTIFKLLGVPDSDVADVKRWAESRALLTWGDLTPEQQLPHAHNLVKYWQYCEAQVARAHREPGDDLPSDLVRVQAETGEISDQEIAGVCWSLLFAGHETTTTLIGNAVRELLVHGVWARLVAEPARIPAATEEVLRYAPSIIAWRRKALQDTVVAGQTLPAGAELLLIMGSGNRDESQFTDPERFDIDRANARAHISLGYGIHFCVGAPLARLQLKVVLEELTQTLPGLELVPDQAFGFVPNTSFRAPLALHVRWS